MEHSFRKTNCEQFLLEPQFMKGTLLMIFNCMPLVHIVLGIADINYFFVDLGLGILKAFFVSATVFFLYKLDVHLRRLMAHI